MEEALSNNFETVLWSILFTLISSSLIKERCSFNYFTQGDSSIKVESLVHNPERPAAQYRIK